MSLKEQVLNHATQNPKVAAAVSTSTLGTGIADILDIIPDDIGKLATLIGAVLSIVLIYTHLRKGRLEVKKIELEMEIMRSNELDRKEEAELRKKLGLPTRRKDDA